MGYTAPVMLVQTSRASFALYVDAIQQAMSKLSGSLWLGTDVQVVHMP